MAGGRGLALARAGASSMRRGCRTYIETFPPICGYSYIRLRQLDLLSDDPITCRGSFLAAGVCGGLWRVNALVPERKSGFPLRVSRFPPGPGTSLLQGGAAARWARQPGVPWFRSRRTPPRAPGSPRKLTGTANGPPITEGAVVLELRLQGPRGNQRQEPSRVARVAL